MFQLGELYDVLRRASIRAIHGRDDHSVRRVISRIYKLAVVVPLPANIPAVVVGDPDDDPIVMTAIIGRADVLCTLDRDLHTPAVLEFCLTKRLRVLKDADLLAELRDLESG